MICWQLFYEFLKTGLFAVGGGLATLPFLYDMSLRTGWFSSDDLTNMIAVSESTPGPLGINMAAYTGFLAGGILGAAAAVTGLIFPSVVIIILIARILEKMKGNVWIEAAFCGLKPASFALIALAWLNVLKLTYHPASLVDQAQAAITPFFWQGLVLAAILFLILRQTKAHPILIILLAALAGIVFQF